MRGGLKVLTGGSHRHLSPFRICRCRWHQASKASSHDAYRARDARYSLSRSDRERHAARNFLASLALYSAVRVASTFLQPITVYGGLAQPTRSIAVTRPSPLPFRSRPLRVTIVAASILCLSPGALGPASRLRRRYADAPAGALLNRSRCRSRRSVPALPSLSLPRPRLLFLKE